MSTWKPILAALVIFAAGVVTGGLTVKMRTTPLPSPSGPRSYDSRPGVTPRMEGQLRELSKRMEKHLDLTPQQREEIETIVRDSQKRMRGMWEEIAPRTRDEFRQTHQRIREVLKPEQRRKFEELFKERESLGKRGNKHAPPETPPSQNP